MADDESRQIGQDEIEQLLKQAKAAGPRSPAADASAAEAASAEQDKIKAPFEQEADAKHSPPGRTGISAEAALEEGSHPRQEDGEGTGGKSVSALAGRTGAAAPSETAGTIAPGDVELLLAQAERALASLDEPQPGMPVGAKPFELNEFAGASPSTDAATLDLLRDVELDLRIEFGRTHMHLEDVLKLRKGSVVALDKLAGDPVDIFVNGRLIARGEVLVLNDNFCVRVAELVAAESLASPF